MISVMSSIIRVSHPISAVARGSTATFNLFHASRIFSELVALSSATFCVLVLTPSAAPPNSCRAGIAPLRKATTRRAAPSLPNRSCAIASPSVSVAAPLICSITAPSSCRTFPPSALTRSANILNAGETRVTSTPAEYKLPNSAVVSSMSNPRSLKTGPNFCRFVASFEPSIPHFCAAPVITSIAEATSCAFNPNAVPARPRASVISVAEPPAIRAKSCV